MVITDYTHSTAISAPPWPPPICTWTIRMMMSIGYFGWGCLSLCSDDLARHSQCRTRPHYTNYPAPGIAYRRYPSLTDKIARHPAAAYRYRLSHDTNYPYYHTKSHHDTARHSPAASNPNATLPTTPCGSSTGHSRIQPRLDAGPRSGSTRTARKG